jgi:hypothetical protein
LKISRELQNAIRAFSPAYELYQRRDPNIGSAESDWWAAEAEIEGQRSEMGLARAKEGSKLKAVTSDRSEDISEPHVKAESGRR